MTGIDLHDLAADIAAVIEHDRSGSAFVVGHAFGNRVARMLATDRPDLVQRGVAGRRQCWACAEPAGRARSHQGERQPVAARRGADCKALQFAFFAPGNDARGWLAGWHPEVLAAQRIAGDRTSRQEDYAAGTAPILYLQPDHDPLAHVEDAHEFKRALGERVTVTVISHCSHAAIEEQPEVISDLLIAYA